MVEIVSRAGWGAAAPKSVDQIPLPTPRLWVHHSADDRQGSSAMRAHQLYHQATKGWLDFAYTYGIDDYGTIFEGRGPGVAGGHTAGDNFTSHAIVLLGNFENRAPTAAALDSLVELARYGRDQGWWVPTLGGHRDAPGAQTACPGRHLYAQLPDLRRRVAGAVPATSAPSPPHQEDDDMPIMISADGLPVALLSGNELVPFAKPATMKALAAAGIQRAHVDVADYHRFNRGFAQGSAAAEKRIAEILEEIVEDTAALDLRAEAIQNSVRKAEE